MDAFKPTVTSPTVTPSFKGIALFTPGGDCVYCIDRQKRSHWHLDLCGVLQQHMGLPEPPYFLLPGFTATVDRWIDDRTQTLVTVAEAYPRVLQFQPLLNHLFDLGELIWQPNYSSGEACSPTLINSYRDRFPQLWQCHDLIIQVEAALAADPPLQADPPDPWSQVVTPTQPYHFKLFVRDINAPATEQMLRLLHTTLESALPSPYTLQVIDVAKQPDLAEADQVSAAPTLIQTSPEPVRRIVGSLLNQHQMIELLGAS